MKSCETAGRKMPATSRNSRAPRNIGPRPPGSAPWPAGSAVHLGFETFIVAERLAFSCADSRVRRRAASRGAVWEAVLPEQVISCGTGWVLTRIRISGAAQWPMRPRGQTLLARPDRALKRHETGPLCASAVLRGARRELHDIFQAAGGVR